MPRIKLTRRSGTPTALTAAAQRVTETSGLTGSRSSLSSGSDWQTEAWRYLGLVGELAFVVNWKARAVSRVRLIASALDDKGEPTGEVDDSAEAEAVRRIVHAIGKDIAGRSNMLKRMALLLSVPGECWVGMIVRDPDPRVTIETPEDLRDLIEATEQWFVFGRTQISSTGRRIDLTLPDGTKHRFNPDQDILFRVWDEHPEDPTKPISAVWSNLTVLNEIVRTTATIDNAARSRLIGNGILAVSNESSIPSQASPVAQHLGEDVDDPIPQWEPNGAQELQDLIYDIATTATKDPDSLAALVPIIMTVPGDQVKNIQWLRPASDIPETALKTRTEAIKRLAMGLDVSPERLLGMATGNHWSAWAIDDSDVKTHIAPLVELICSTLTQEILRLKLRQEGIDPNKYVIWYDISALTQDPDKSDEAQTAFDRGALTAKSLREHLGFDDEDGYDLTTSEGWVQLALDKIAADPSSAAIFQPIINAAAAQVGLDIALPVALPAGTTPPEDESEADSEPEQPQEEPEEDPPIVGAAIQTVAAMSVNRALELANKRRRTRADYPTYRGIPIELAHTRLEPAKYEAVPEMIKGWDVGLSDTDIESLGLNPDQFRATVTAIAATALVTSSRPVINADQLRRKVPYVPSES